MNAFMDYLLGHHFMAIPSDSDDDSTLEERGDTPLNDDSSPEDVIPIIDFLQTHSRLFEVVSNRLDDFQTRKNILFKGAVQSGKSALIHALAFYHTLHQRSNVIIIVRNFTHDYEQLHRGLEAFLSSYQEEEEDGEDHRSPIFYIGNVPRRRDDDTLVRHEDLCYALSAGGAVLLCLANSDQLRKVNECLDLIDNEPPLRVIVDEADQLLYTEGVRLTPLLSHLLDKAVQVIGISATFFEAFQDPEDRFSTGSVFLLTPPANYKGIMDIGFEAIEPLPKDSSGSSLEDDELHRVLENLKTTSPFDIGKGERHPVMVMVKTERLIKEQDTLASSLLEKFPEYVYITYNGTSCSLYSSLLAEKTSLTLPVCYKRSKNVRGHHEFRNCALPYVLQHLKNHGGVSLFPRIVLIAYQLVGRGLNIVSYDFEWHLTHMFYRPTSKTDGTTMLQSMRLCGIYRDNIRLTCFMEKKAYDNMYKAHQLQEDMFRRALTHEDKDATVTEMMRTQHFHRHKVPHAALTSKGQRFKGNVTDREEEDEGMSLEEFAKERCIQEPYKKAQTQPVNVGGGGMTAEELHRLTNPVNGMFKRWADPTNTTAIARFMREGLDPHREYTRKEMRDLCKEYRVQLGHITKIGGQSSNTNYGMLLTRHHIGNTFSLHQQLRNAFHEYF